jgi:hypothetical protein
MKKVFYFACLLMPALGMAQDGTTTTTTQQTTTTPGSATINMSIGGSGMNTGMSTQQTTTTITTTTTTSGDATQQAPPPPTQQAVAPVATGCQEPMMEDDYQSAKKSIEDKTFEDTKLTLAKQIAGNNCLSAGQIRGIMKLFTFENSKLDFAKFAYSHCTDKTNYFKVDDAFEFDNSTQQLNDYISKQ